MFVRNGLLASAITLILAASAGAVGPPPKHRFDRAGSSLPRGAIARFGAGPPPSTKHPMEIRGLAFSPDGEELLSQTAKDGVCQWDVATNRLKRTLLTKDSWGFGVCY